MKEQKPINVVAGVIRKNGKVLCVQRGKSNYDYVSFKWEFPGGKIENDESDIAALIREIDEELGMNIIVEEHLITVNHSYPDFEIRMKVYLCDTNDMDVKLREHISYKWLPFTELDLDWAEADKPVVKMLISSNS